MHYPGCPEHNARQSLSGDPSRRLHVGVSSQTAQSLTKCFQDEVTIEPGEVIAVLAAATLLALEGLISQVMHCQRADPQQFSWNLVSLDFVFVFVSVTFGVTSDLCKQRFPKPKKGLTGMG